MDGRQYPLPLSLQDLCLVVVINDLDSYPVELLASLPRWLRYRLLNNLPSLDLCRLDNTSIAIGVDIEEIWNSKTELPRLPFETSYTSEPPFSNCISEASELYHHVLSLGNVETSDEGPAITLREQSLTNKDKSQSREKYFCNVLSNIFEYEIHAAIDLLISIYRGDLFHKLTTADDVHQSVHPSSGHPMFTHRRPKQVQFFGLRVAQTTPLASYGIDILQLAPRRLLHILDPFDPLELFSFIVHDCGFQPATLRLKLTHSKSWTQCLLEGEKFSNVLSHFLQKTVTLEVNSARMHKDVVPVLQGVLEAAVSRNGGSSRLRYLCWPSMTTDVVEYLSPYLFTLPSNPAQCHARYQGLDMLDLGTVYQDAFPDLTALFEHQSILKYVNLNVNIHDHQRVQASTVNLFSALSSLLSKPHFEILWLQVACCFVTCKSLLRQLLWQFMTALCTRAKELHLWVYKDYTDCNCTTEVEDVPFYSQLMVPKCGLEHKALNTNMMELVLEMPTIRLKNFVFDHRGMDYPYCLHCGALHPDLQVAKLTLFDNQVNDSTFFATLQDDLIAFFEKPTLQEVSISGKWVECEEKRCALMLALHRRAQVGSLRKILLSDCDDQFPQPRTMPGVHNSTFFATLQNIDFTAFFNLTTYTHPVYDYKDSKGIWDAIFSLPKLDQMELVIAGNLSEWILQNEHLFHESWKQFGSQRQIKLLKFVPYSKRDRAPEILYSLAQTIDISTPASVMLMQP